MKRYLSIVCTFLGFSGLLSAQNPEEHKKTTYTDSLGRFIVQVDMPLYVFVSTSLDETPRRLERSDKPENEPIYLDGPGKHYIRHQDAINHRADMFPIWADGQAPQTTLSLTGSQTIVRDGVNWYGSNLTITLRTTDDLAGVKQTYYAIDDGNFTPYINNIEIKEEGLHKISFYSVDNVGNVETVKHREFSLDLTPPVTTIQVDSFFRDDIIANNARITLSSTDNLTGVERIMYRFNNEPERQYRVGTNISFAHLPDGLHTMTYYAEDRLKNKEQEKSISFFIDKMPPIVSADVLGDRFIVGDRVYFSGRSKLKLTAVDNRSGIKEILYSINNGPFQEYEDPFYLPAVAGRHTIRYYATDEMENTTRGNYTHSMGIVWVDLVGPILSHSLSGPSFTKGDVQFISPETRIVLRGVDAESGLQYLSYSIGNQIEETRFDEYFSIKESGTHTIRYFGYDNVNNRNSNQFEVTVDGDGPEVFNTFSVSPANDANTDGIDVFPSYVLLYLAATDMLTGNAEIYYSINDAREIQYTAPIRGFAKNTSYTVVVRARDQLGNFSEKTIQFRTNDF